MKSFLQWGLVTTIALFVIATLGRSILTQSTKRRSDISIAKLEKTLSNIDAQLPGSGIKPEVPALRTDAILDKTHDSVDNLRKAWLAWYDTLQAAQEACANDDDVIKAVVQEALGDKDGTVADIGMYSYPAFIDCLREPIVELVALCEKTSRLTQSERNQFLQYVELYETLRSAVHVLEDVGQITPLPGTQPEAIDIIIARFQMVALDDDASIWWESDENWVTKGITGTQRNWVAQRIGVTLTSGEVSDAHWDRLLAELEQYRSPDRYITLLTMYTKHVIDSYETWPQSLGIRFSDNPFFYGQNWAYRHVTTPLFHHDLDRFGKAIPELLALAPLPFFEAAPALNEFYETYDVEPRIQDIKLTRQNLSWGCIVGVSRHAFGLHAREQAAVDLATVAILLERVRKDTGAYPDTLDGVAMVLGDAPLLNPIDGQPYLYERRGDSYRLGYTQTGVFEVAPEPAVFWNDGDRALLMGYIEELAANNEVQTP